jgi:cardiolipin synthase
VRLLLDYVGCLHSLGRRLDEFKSAGGELGLFMPVGRFSLRRRIDLRSHRKIAIADGTRCWTGGMNIATEYMGPSPKRDRWVDLAYSIEGPAVRLLWEVFRRDWEFATDQQLVPLTEQDFAKGDGSSSTQVVPSGPDIDGDPLYDSILAAIHAAEKRAWVVTPYFVPDEILMNALILAVRRGVDVRLIMPERSNHPLTDLVRGSYLRELQSRGARICLYEAGMMHAKGMLFDDVALLGSMNLDARSLFLNYEIATYLYDREAVAEVEGWMRSLLARCRSGVRPVGAVRDFFEGVVRMGAPLL